MVDLRTAARLFAAFQREAAPPVPSREAPLPVADIMDPPSDADDDDARTAKRVAAVTSVAHQKAYERKLRLTRDELAQYSVQDILFCEELWQRWVEASADDAVRGARRKELLQALAGALGTSVPSASVIGTAPSGASRFLVELAGLLLEPELPATASTPAPPTLRSRLTSAIGLRARFAALEKSSSRANAGVVGGDGADVYHYAAGGRGVPRRLAQAAGLHPWCPPCRYPSVGGAPAALDER